MKTGRVGTLCPRGRSNVACRCPSVLYQLRVGRVCPPYALTYKSPLAWAPSAHAFEPMLCVPALMRSMPRTRRQRLPTLRFDLQKIDQL
jgi:hypothetical protein